MIRSSGDQGDWDQMSDQKALPDITNLSVLLSDGVADMGMAQLKRHFRQHHLRWEKHDPLVANFCTRQCQSAAECPAGYTCSLVNNTLRRVADGFKNG